MPINSRSKGKRIELEFAHLLTEYGHEARRGQQFSGGADSPDVICQSLPIHWEVKGVEKLNLFETMENLIEECPKGKWRAVAWKKNRLGWLISLPAEDFFDLIKEWKELKSKA